MAAPATELEQIQQAVQPPLAALETVPLPVSASISLEEFTQLYHEHWYRIFCLCWKILKNQGEAEEIAQDTMLKAWCHLKTFRGESEFGTWLYRIAVRECLMVLRRRGRTTLEPLCAVSLDDKSDDELGYQLADREDLRPDALVRQSNLREILQRVIAGLPTSYRVVFVLRYVEGLSTREVAAALGRNESGVKAIAHRSRVMMQDRLRDRNITVG